MHDPVVSERGKRIDLTAIKLRLQSALGAAVKDNFSAYWEYLRKYVQAKLSKRELEQIARNLLGEDNLYLHNIFIQAILANARSSHLPEVPPQQHTYTRPTKKTYPASKTLVPSSTSSNVSNHSSSMAANPMNNTPNSNLGLINSSSSTFMPNNSNTFNNANIKKIPKNKPKMYPNKPGNYRAEKNVSGVPLPYKKPAGVGKRLIPAVAIPPLGPEYNVLRSRLQKIATEAGLSGITHDAIRFMMLAIEMYIKRMLNNAKTTPRLTTIGSTSVTINNLYKTTILHPSLLGEDFLLHQERLTLALM